MSFNKPLFLHLARSNGCTQSSLPSQGGNLLNPPVMSPPLTPDRLQYYESEGGHTAALLTPSYAKNFHSSLFDIHDYFDNNERRKGNVQDAMSMSITLSPAVDPESHLYVVEFKAGRKDIFYYPPGGQGPNIPTHAHSNNSSMISSRTMSSSSMSNGSGMLLGSLTSSTSVSSSAGSHHQSNNNHPDLREGDCVIVEADRGTDLGKLVDITSESIGELLQGHGPYSAQLIASLTNFSLKRIYRAAHSAEILMIVSKNEDEMQAMKLAQEKAIEKGLPMDIVNVEYQWDRRKLTFFYVSLVYIDFRELVRELYRTYKTRIWFVRYNEMKP